MAQAGDTVARWLTILRCGYASRCRASTCWRRAAYILRKSEGNGRPLRQIELCDQHALVVLEREQLRGLGVTDRR